VDQELSRLGGFSYRSGIKTTKLSSVTGGANKNIFNKYGHMFCPENMFKVVTHGTKKI
jgi:hypothetical protein